MTIAVEFCRFIIRNFKNRLVKRLDSVDYSEPVGDFTFETARFPFLQRLDVHFFDYILNIFAKFGGVFFIVFIEHRTVKTIGLNKRAERIAMKFFRDLVSKFNKRFYRI